MTIANTTVKTTPAVGNSVAVDFPFTFKVFAKGDIDVNITVIATGVSTTLVLDSDYSVTLNADQDVNPGGSVRYPLVGSPMTSASELQIISSVDMIQNLRLPSGGGPFNAKVVEDSLDKCLIGVNQLKELGARTLFMPPIDSVSGQLPSATTRALKFLAFDSLGAPIAAVVSGVGSIVSAAMAPVVAAATLAAARAALAVSATIEVILQGLLTTKGDLVGASAASTAVRVPVGTDALQLTADSAQASGLSYKTHNLTARQCALTGSVDANGLANFLTVGAGLRPGLIATAPNLALAFANGFDAGGAADNVSIISASVADIFGADLPASNTSYLHASYTSPSAVTYGNTLVPPQVGEVFDKTRQSLLRFAGADASISIIDDYGNTWAVTGNAQVDTAVQIDGLNTLLLDGAGDFIESTSFTSLGNGGWTLESKGRFNVLPAASTASIVSATNAGGFGLRLGLNDTAGTKKLVLTLSSDGSTADIANAVLGTSTVWAAATTYHIAVTYDPIAGKYFVYKDGVSEAALAITSSLKICTVTKVRYGDNGAGASQLNGALAGCRFSPFCRYPNGTSFAGTIPNISTFAVEGHWFSISEMKMYEVTAASAVAGTNPTMQQRTRTFLGEADTSGAAVTAVRSYAYRGQAVVDSAVLAASTAFPVVHNLGVKPRKITQSMLNISSENGYVNGDECQLTPSWSDGANVRLWSITADKNNIRLVTSANSFVAASKLAATIVVAPIADWKFRFYVDRGW